MSKVKVPVYVTSYASKYIGDVEIESLEEFEDAAEKLWEEMGCEGISTNISNDFEVGDSEISTLDEGDFSFYEEHQKD